jgi:hypothetical protein
MTIPNLAGVITKEDVFRKGTGSYAADYCSWARIANYLHQHAPGWEFSLREAPDGGHVWQAPDGTGYIVSYFIGPDRQFTPDFVFPCQDNRNQPIPFDKVSCRTLTDSHRRALAANAAFTFGLGYELWAREEVESASAQTKAEPEATKRDEPKQAKVSAPKTAKAKPAGDLPLSAEDRQLIIDLISAEAQKPNGTPKVQALCKDFLSHFKLEGKLSDHLTTRAHAEFVEKWFGKN